MLARVYLYMFNLLIGGLVSKLPYLLFNISIQFIYSINHFHDLKNIYFQHHYTTKEKYI